MAPWGLSRSFFRGCKLNMLRTEVFNVCDQQLLHGDAYEQMDAALTVVENGGWLLVAAAVFVVVVVGRRRCCAKRAYSSRKPMHQA